MLGDIFSDNLASLSIGVCNRPELDRDACYQSRGEGETRILHLIREIYRP